MAEYGLARYPHILTEEDVLRHCYGVEPEGSSSDPDPTPSLSSDPDPDPSDPGASEDADPGGSSEKPLDELSEPELAAKLESENTKAALQAIAEQIGVDQSGNKADIAARIAAHYRAPKS